MSVVGKNTLESYLSYSKFPISIDTDLEVFKTHWLCVVKAMSKEYLTMDESEPVIYYMDQMILLMIEEKTMDIVRVSSPIFQYSIQQNLYNKIYEWSSKFMGEALERLKHQQLRMFSIIVSQAPSAILHCKEILEPLLRLINSYSLRSSLKLEQSLINLLQLICVRASDEPTLQCICTEIGITVLHDPLPLLNPLVPFLHREGILGQEAKKAVLLLGAVSLRNEEIAISVALQSDFCPVLATGLSALYSALPRQLPSYCHSILLGQINDSVIHKYPQLQHFLQYLSFCCQVNKISHPLIREAVLHYVYNGFLLPVIGSSFHQNSIDEVITATIYFELFLRTITESGLLKAFLCFLVAESYDGYRLIDTLLNRLNSNTGLGVVTLSLMNTIISFNCEDVMFELVFRHLIPCKHLSLKEDSPICDRESLKNSFEIFFELTINPYEPYKEIEHDILLSASKLVDHCNYSCEQSWQFDYDGINPSPDYLDKVTGDSSEHQKPFHGFLDHYSQLLEMRDHCRKPSASSPAVSRRSNSSASTFTTKSPISRSNSFDTLTSLKFEKDSQLELCLQRLKFPSAEDLLEQKAHYMISYNIPDQMTDDDSIVSSPSVTRKLNGKNPRNKYVAGFDLVRAISGESVTSEPFDSVISTEDLDKLANAKEVEQFTARLDKLDIDPKELRNCAFSLDEVMSTIENITDRSNEFVDGNEAESPTGSVISLQSALTIDDNILKQTNHKPTNRKTTNHNHRKIATVGLFLHTILELLEKFHLNPFQINMQLTAIITSLLSFPQPLIRNYLLNPREELSDGIKCFYNILSAVKAKIDESKIKINISKKDEHHFKKMCLEARSRLDKRLSLLQSHDLECEEQIRNCGHLQNTETDVSMFKLNKTEKRHFNLLQFLSRKPGSNEAHINNGWSSARSKQSKEEMEYCTHLNLAFASVLFEEFCKEIASFSKEHYVFRR